MILPILYTFRRCPYAMRARISMYYAGVSYEHREILLKNRPEKLYQLSPKGTVPVLHLTDGKVIDESLDIMKWSVSLNDPDCWFSNNINHQLETISTNDLEFKKWLDRYKYHTRYPEYSAEYYRDKCEKTLNTFEKILANNNFLFGKNISLGDMALLPFVRQFAHIDINWFRNRFVNLSKWMDRLISMEVFQAMMKKFEVWHPLGKGEEVIFND